MILFIGDWAWTIARRAAFIPCDKGANERRLPMCVACQPLVRPMNIHPTLQRGESLRGFYALQEISIGAAYRHKQGHTS